MKSMRIVPGAFALALAGAAQAEAQQPAPQVAAPEELNAVVTARAAEADEQRARLRAVLERPDVQAVAGGYGFDVTRVLDAVGTLTAEQLQFVAPQLEAAEAALAGGQVITITATTLIIVLLLILLIIAVA